MAENKATSFRVGEEDLEKFRLFMEERGMKTQAEGFKAIMQSVEMAQAKETIKDRAKEIEIFQNTINELMGYFLNSLNVNQNSEERIREELSKELSTKDNTISTMFEQLQELKADKINSDNNLKDINSKNKELQEQLQKANNEIVEKNKSIDKLNSNNDLLQENLQEYKQYKDNYKQLEKELDQLKVDTAGLTTDKTTVENTVTRLQGEIDNKDNMITFYKDNNTDLKKDIDTYKNDIKLLEVKYNKQVEEVKAEHEKAIHEQLENVVGNLNNKQEVELSKKDLEIQKLNNLIEQLQNSNKKKTVKEEK